MVKEERLPERRWYPTRRLTLSSPSKRLEKREPEVIRFPKSRRNEERAKEEGRVNFQQSAEERREGGDESPKGDDELQRGGRTRFPRTGEKDRRVARD